MSTASISGTRPAAGESPYAASKAAVAALTASAALEYGPSIRVNAVSPGMIRTAMTAQMFEFMPNQVERFEKGTPVARIGEPEDIADVVVFLCSDLARFVTGQNIVVDGGSDPARLGRRRHLRHRVPGEAAASRTASTPPERCCRRRTMPVRSGSGVRVEERPVDHGGDRLESHVVDRLPHEFTQVVEAVEHGQRGKSGGIGIDDVPEESGPICSARAPDMTVNVLRITSMSSGSMVARSVQARNSGA